VALRDLLDTDKTCQSPAYPPIMIGEDGRRRWPDDAVEQETGFRDLRKNFAFSTTRPLWSFDNDDTHS